MSENPFLPNNDHMNGNLYTGGGYDKKRLSIVVVVFVSALVIISILIFVFRGGQDKYTQSATAAARKVTPNAKVSDLKVAGGFALASVNSPTASGQGKSGNLTVFRVNPDSSMTQIADGSSFGPVDLLELGIPLATQAQLTKSDVTQVKQNFANQCGYNGDNAPGYRSFGGSFSPGEWQIDAFTLDGLEQALTTVIRSKNANAKSDEKVICINATREKSNAATDRQTYISTFTLELQFITGDGTVTPHIFTFAVGPNYYRSYTLDGRKLQAI